MTQFRKICVILRKYPTIDSIPFTSRALSVKKANLIGLDSKKFKKRKMNQSFRSEGFHEIGDFSVFARSISGLETTVVVRGIQENISICFDMGTACRENQGCDKVFIRYILTLIWVPINFSICEIF